MSKSDDYVLPGFFNLDRTGEQGHNAIMMGSPGEGKTSLLEYLTVLAARGKDVYGDTREKQACIWRARRHDRYLEFFGLNLGKLLLPRNSAYSLLKVYNDNTREEISVEELEGANIEYGFYTFASDIIDQLEVGKILCILFPGDSLEETKFYSELFQALVNRKTDEWVHISVDEAGDILAPYNSDSYKIQKRFIDSVADFRKTNINSEMACHSYTDLDYRIVPKMKYHIYKRGAKKMPGETNKVKQETINNTEKGQAWFINGPFFDKLEFPEMTKDARLDFKLQTISRSMVVDLE
jgi:hypothetical protein